VKCASHETRARTGGLDGDTTSMTTIAMPTPITPPSI
jgi:hypothetical protein